MCGFKFKHNTYYQNLIVLSLITIMLMKNAKPNFILNKNTININDPLTYGHIDTYAHT